MKRHQYKHIRDKERIEQIDAEQRGRRDHPHLETQGKYVTYPKNISGEKDHLLFEAHDDYVTPRYKQEVL